MRTIIWLNTESVIETEIDRLTKKLKKCKSKAELRKLEKEINRLYELLNTLE